MSKRLVCGVGTNDSLCRVSRYGPRNKLVWVCPYYSSWKRMLNRCYSSKVHSAHPSYVGCTVWDEWLTFSKFKAWMETQDWEGKNLDKDILVPGNKLYSPETCVFVSAVLNTFITDGAAIRGEYPIGVRWCAGNKKLEAWCRNPFSRKQEYLGGFTTSEEAHQAWRRRKHELACRYADMQTDPRVAEALRARFAPQ